MEGDLDRTQKKGFAQEAREGCFGEDSMRKGREECMPSEE